MHIFLVTHYFPPESNAPANRAVEHARAWVALGHRVTVVTAQPSHPGGRLYPGYRNVFARETMDGIEVIRLKTFIAENKGIAARSLAFTSFLTAVAKARGKLPRADVVVSTSPQFFSGLAGRLLKRKGARWVLEIRDLWPESILAVGAMGRNPAIRALEWLEGWAYRSADLVVTTTDAHRAHVLAKRGREGVVTIRNGITPGLLESDASAGTVFRAEHGLEGKFVAAYVGTHGMAHALDTVLDAAELTRERDDIHWLLVGDGAERARLAGEAARRDLPNLTMLGHQARERVPAIWAASDAALVLLKKSDTFRSVLPSKLVEAMALGKPAILGVEGEAEAVLHSAGAGIAIPPQDARALADAAIRLADDPALVKAISERGRRHARTEFDRTKLAGRMAAAMETLR